jgi:hypothetical protein
MPKGENSHLKIRYWSTRYRNKQRKSYKERKFKEVQLTYKDKQMQKKVEAKLKRTSDESMQAIMAGSIPKLDMDLMKEYLTELEKIRGSNFKGKEEIAKMEVLLLNGQKVMQTLLDMYDKLDISQMTDKDAMVAVVKFRTTFFNKWAVVSEEMRRSIETIHEFKYGKRIINEQGKTIEDAIDAVAKEVK